MQRSGVKARRPSSAHAPQPHAVALPLVLFLVVLVSFAIFGRLSVHVWNTGGFAWDDPVLRAIHGHATSSRDRIAVALTIAGSTDFMIPLAVAIALVLLVRRRWSAARFFVLATGGAAALNILAKQLFERPRPLLWISPAPEVGYGFPSGHAMGSMAVTAAIVSLAWHTRWRRPLLVIGSAFVLIVGVSRMYLGMDYPSDVLGGWCASFAWVAGLHLIFDLTARPGWWNR